MPVETLVDRAARLVGDAGTAVLGIAGAPGSGKSTLAEWLVARLRERLGDGDVQAVAHAPMDGFHLADVELRRLHRLDRKGAPDTFDLAGFAALLRRVREVRTETVYAPMFERGLEQPIAGAIPIGPATRVLVTEGNYLLLPGWSQVRDLLDEVWFCTLDDDARRERLVGRHVRFGKRREQAARWVDEVDESNARLVAQYAHTADLLVPGGLPGPSGAVP